MLALIKISSNEAIVIVAAIITSPKIIKELRLWYHFDKKSKDNKEKF